MLFLLYFKLFYNIIYELSLSFKSVARAASSRVVSLAVRWTHCLEIPLNMLHTGGGERSSRREFRHRSRPDNIVLLNALNCMPTELRNKWGTINSTCCPRRTAINAHTCDRTTTSFMLTTFHFRCNFIVSCLSIHRFVPYICCVSLWSISCCLFFILYFQYILYDSFTFLCPIFVLCLCEVFVAVCSLFYIFSTFCMIHSPVCVLCLLRLFVKYLLIFVFCIRILYFIRQDENWSCWNEIFETNGGIYSLGQIKSSDIREQLGVFNINDKSTQYKIN